MSNTAVISTMISDALTQLGVGEVSQIHWEHPADMRHGDYSTNIALSTFSTLQQRQLPYKSPRDFAQAIVTQLQKTAATQPHALVDQISVAGPGFINVTLSNSFLFKELTKVVQSKELAELSKKGKKQKVIVEYSSANIAKPFTIGHLRSTIIGDATANILAATGAEVFRDNHLGDWGTQFGKQISAIKHFGDEQKIENSAEPVKELVALYVKFHQEVENDPTLEDEARAWFKKLEAGDPEARRLWKKCIEWSMKEFQRIYKLLGVRFTENGGLGYGESFFEDKMQSVIDELKRKKLLKESEGASLVFFPHDKYPPLMILKKDGATLYSTRDLATDKFRLARYGKDIVIINEVGAEQSLYFQQIYATEEMLGWYKPGQRFHLKHGHYKFKDKKMSTRKGNVIWLEDVLQQAFEEVKKRSAQAKVKKMQGKKAANISDPEMWKIAIGALKWNDLKREPAKEIVFDWDEMLNLQGNSGPYMQYTYARARSVLQKAKITKPNDLPKHDPNHEEKAVLRLLYQFSEIVERAAAEYAPHFIATYLFELAQTFNAFYNAHSILGTEKKPVAEQELQFRLLLTQATSLILQHGLNLLGIETVEKM